MASLLAALLIAALAYVVTERRGMAQEMATARTDLAMRQALITSEIARFRLLPIALADDRDVTSALAGNLGARDALNRKLEALVTATGAPIIYVIGQDGKAIAASNWRSPQSFVGADYSARRYFRDALKMGGASHFAMGTVSHRPGLYIAQRTAQGGSWPSSWNSTGSKRLGPRGWRHIRYRKKRYCAGFQPSGMAFFLTRPFQRPFKPTLTMKRCFPLPSRFVPISLDGTRTTWLGNPIVMLRAPLAQAGWSITLMRPVGRAILFAWIAAIITAALVLGMAIIGWMWMERGRERAARTEELEQAVADRTADLRREMDERAALEARAADLREGLRQANRLAALGQITASVAHETAQPVAAIRTYAETSRILLERGDNQTWQRI
jgi:two-component system C4-dicarboxylate transport sensor histidine kinase DctB